MLREKTFVISIVFSLLALYILPFQVNGQIAKFSTSIEKKELANISSIKNPPSSSFLKKGSEESEIRASLDQIEKEQYKSSYTRKRAMSSKAKAGIFIGIGAAVAVVIIAVLVSRDKKMMRMIGFFVQFLKAVRIEKLSNLKFDKTNA